MSKEISAQLVMDLRKRTGVGMSQCKEALVEAKGDIEEAIHILRKKGVASAVKKGAREANEGIIGFAENDKQAYLVEVNAETDFVVQNDRFKEFLKNICEEALLDRPKSVEDFLKKKYSKQPSLTIDEYRAEIVHSLGENIVIRRILDFTKGPERSIGIYSHMGGKIVTVVVLKGASGFENIAREVAMHVAAEAPDYLRVEDVPEEVRQKEVEIATSQIKNKPANMIEKIVAGKVKAFCEQACLAVQKFVKDPSMNVGEYVEAAAKQAGKKLELAEFVRWQIGS